MINPEPPQSDRLWTINDLAKCPRCQRVDLHHAYVDFKRVSKCQWPKVHQCPGCLENVKPGELIRVPRDDYNYGSGLQGWHLTYAAKSNA